MKIVLSTVAYGRAGGTESVAHDLLTGLIQRGYRDITILTETFSGIDSPVPVTKDFYVLKFADVVIQVGVFSNLDHAVIDARRKKFYEAPLLVWAIEPDEKLFRWCADLYSGIPHNKLLLVYSVEYGKHRLDRLRLGHLAMKVPYGVQQITGRSGFKRKYGIATSKMFLTVGGFDARKRQHELIKVFKDAKVEDTTLVVTGHRNLDNMPNEQDGVRVFMVPDKQGLMDIMFESDLLIMNSEYEGFGLVLLEAMFNKTPWAANKVGAAVCKEDLADYGYVYENDAGLVRAFTEYKNVDVMKAYRFAEASHRVDLMLDGIEAGLKRLTEGNGK